jgi:integrase
VKYRTTTGKQVFKGGFRSKTEASEYLKEALGQIDKGIYIEQKATVFEKFAEDRLAGRRRIRGSTESGYGSIIKCHFIPHLGPIRVANLSLKHIETLVAEMIEAELSNKHVHNAATLLRTMLVGRNGASAMRLGYISHDPTLGLELPPIETREVIPPTQEEVWKLINVAKEIGGVGYPLTFLGAFTGLRRNEALGVRFTDVDWFNHEVRVRNAISKEKGTDGAHKWKWVLGAPKTKKSLRRVALTESALMMLADLKAIGDANEGFLFEGQGGGFIDPDKFNAEIWAPIAAGADMKGTRYRDLRHFFASQLIAQGESPAHVRDQLGHSSIKVTFDTYGHLFPGAGREAAARFDNSMKIARAKASINGSNLVAVHLGSEGDSAQKQSRKTVVTN